jgi:murein DD-endopeptidase MepM/ murein hydrolase activator NlpD
MEAAALASQPPAATPSYAQETVPIQSLDAPAPSFDFGTFSARDVSGRAVPSTILASAPAEKTVAKPAAKKAPRKPRKRFAARVFPLFAMLFAGALLVGVSVPASAFIDEDVVLPMAATSALPGQSLGAAADYDPTAIKRDLPTVTSYAALLAERYGSMNFSYEATNGRIRWPFAISVPISDGYGARVAPCRGCSTMHRGVDFVPGDGSPISAIAAGTVVFTEVTNGGIGNQVQIEHEINGMTITSVYAGMRSNSSPLHVGDKVAVGDFVGLVGMTGVATGPHLHFELLVNGDHTDPFAWLKVNATNKG